MNRAIRSMQADIRRKFGDVREALGQTSNGGQAFRLHLAKQFGGSKAGKVGSVHGHVTEANGATGEKLHCSAPVLFQQTTSNFPSMTGLVSRRPMAARTELTKVRGIGSGLGLSPVGGELPRPPEETNRQQSPEYHGDLVYPPPQPQPRQCRNRSAGFRPHQEGY